MSFLKEVLVNATLAISGRDRGIKKAVDHAERELPEWGEQAYDYLVAYVAMRGTIPFLAEQVRVASVGSVPEPPSNRAWGGVFKRAATNDVITKVGFGQTTNPKAHRAIATLWVKGGLPF